MNFDKAPEERHFFISLEGQKTENTIIYSHEGFIEIKNNFAFYDSRPAHPRRTGIFNEKTVITFVKDTGDISLETKVWQKEAEKNSSPFLYFSQYCYLKEALKTCNLSLSYEVDNEGQLLINRLKGILPNITTEWSISFKAPAFLPNTIESISKNKQKSCFGLNINTSSRRPSSVFKAKHSVSGKGMLMMPRIMSEAPQLLVSLAGFISSSILWQTFPVNLWLEGRESLTKEEIQRLKD